MQEQYNLGNQADHRDSAATIANLRSTYEQRDKEKLDTIRSQADRIAELERKSAEDQKAAADAINELERLRMCDISAADDANSLYERTKAELDNTMQKLKKQEESTKGAYTKLRQANEHIKSLRIDYDGAVSRLNELETANEVSEFVTTVFGKTLGDILASLGVNTALLLHEGMTKDDMEAAASELTKKANDAIAFIRQDAAHTMKKNGHLIECNNLLLGLFGINEVWNIDDDTPEAVRARLRKAYEEAKARHESRKEPRKIDNPGLRNIDTAAIPDRSIVRPGSKRAK